VLAYPFDLKAMDGRTIAHEVAKAGQLKYLMSLKELGLDLREEDEKGFSSLFYIMTTDLGVTYRNIYFKRYRIPNLQVFSALELAVAGNEEGAVNYLLSEYDFEITDGRIIDEIRNSDIAKIMIAAGIDPDITGLRGNSFASKVIMDGKSSVISVLYHSGYRLKSEYDVRETTSVDEYNYEEEFNPEYEKYKVLLNYYESAYKELQLGSCGAKLELSNFPYGRWIEKGSTSNTIHLSKDGAFEMVHSYFDRTDTANGTWTVEYCGIEVSNEDGRITYYPIRKYTGDSFELSFNGLDRKYVLSDI